MIFGEEPKDSRCAEPEELADIAKSAVDRATNGAMEEGITPETEVYSDGQCWILYNEDGEEMQMMCSEQGLKDLLEAQIAEDPKVSVIQE